MEIKPIAYFRSPFSSKFGIPKQAGLVAELEGQIVFEPESFQSSGATCSPFPCFPRRA